MREEADAKPAPDGDALDLERLSADERATTDPRALVAMLVAHARLIAEAKRPDGPELGLRKATRAHLAAQELGDQELVVEALRARMEIAKRAPGRHELAAKLSSELVALLEALPDSRDTRRERALLLVEAWAEPWWWYAEQHSLDRAKVAADEAHLRKALSLLLDLGDDDVADEVAFVAAQLIELLERCKAFDAAAALRADLRRASAAVREACEREGPAL